jgi:ribonuclease HI/ribosome-binding protein aMBF1 (putative translation factor)
MKKYRQKKTHKFAIKESSLLSAAQPTSSLDQIHEILEHIEIYGHLPKFKRHNTASTDGSLLKTNPKNCTGAAVVFETNMNNYYRNQLTESLKNTKSLLANSTNNSPKEKRKQSTTKTYSKSAVNKNIKPARNKNGNSTNKLANKNKLTAKKDKKIYTTLLNRDIDTTSYHSTLPNRPGSSIRSELWAIIIAPAAIPENTFLTIYTDSKSATAAYKKHLVECKTPRQIFISTCPIEWSILYNLTHRQNKHIAINWIKDNNGYPLNKLTDRKLNDASAAMQLGIAEYNRVNPLILKQTEIKFLYQHGKIINSDFGKFQKNLVQQKTL